MARSFFFIVLFIYQKVLRCSPVGILLLRFCVFILGLFIVLISVFARTFFLPVCFLLWLVIRLISVNLAYYFFLLPHLTFPLYLSLIKYLYPASYLTTSYMLYSKTEIVKKLLTVRTFAYANSKLD